MYHFNLINYLFLVNFILYNIFKKEFDSSSALIDLSYEDKKYRFNYPQNDPLNILLSPSFLKEKQTINIIIMKIDGKKYKKIARGELNIFKKYFQGEKQKIEKYVYLTPYQSYLNLSNNDNQKPELNSGKIYLIINLLEPIEQGKKEKDSNKKNQKKNLNQDNNANENYDDLIINLQFDDNLSDLSISIIDESDEERKGLELNQFVNDDYIQKLKELMASDYEKILPKDIEKLKQMNEMLYSKFSELSNSYNETLFALNSTNEEIRQKAKKYYEDYKKIKKEVYKGRVELKKKNKELQKEIEINNEDNKNLLNEVENLKNETQVLKNKLNIQSEEDIANNNNNQNDNNNDINNLSEVLKKLNNLGIDVISQSGLNDEEKMKLKNILNLTENVKEDNLNNNLNKNENNNIDEDEDLKDDIELGNQIVSLIERDVNDLYIRQIVENVKIDQINAITYSFENDRQSKNVTLKIVDGNLVCSNGVSFNSWLVSNFGTNS